MYKYPILVLKGFIIGIAKIIPGVSGSMLALNLGIYEKSVDSISNFFKDVKYNSIFLFTLGFGFLMSIIFGSNVLNYLFKNYKFVVLMSFIGLIIGSFPKVNFDNINLKKINLFIISFVFLLLFYIFKNNIMYDYKNDLLNNIYVIILGIIDSITMIIPGISGTAIYILLGCYEFVLSIYSGLFSFENISVVILFMVGLLFGGLVMIKFMDYLLKNKKEQIYPIIYGFSFSSFTMLSLFTLSLKYNLSELIVGSILLLINIKVASVFS